MEYFELSFKKPNRVSVSYTSNPQYEKHDPRMEALRDRSVKIDTSRLGMFRMPIIRREYPKL